MVTILSQSIDLRVKVVRETIDFVDYLCKRLLLRLREAQQVWRHVICIHLNHHRLVLHFDAKLLLRLLVGTGSWTLALLQAVLLEC